MFDRDEVVEVEDLAKTLAEMHNMFISPNIMIALTHFLALLFLLQCAESFTSPYYYSSFKTQHQQRRYTFNDNIAEPSKNKYGHDNNKNETKKSQRELLIDLENKFDYEGRISSKIIESNNNDVDGQTASAYHDDTSSLVEHRCALLTILG